MTQSDSALTIVVVVCHVGRPIGNRRRSTYVLSELVALSVRFLCVRGCWTTFVDGNALPTVPRVARAVAVRRAPTKAQGRRGESSQGRGQDARSCRKCGEESTYCGCAAAMQFLGSYALMDGCLLAREGEGRPPRRKNEEGSERQSQRYQWGQAGGISALCPVLALERLGTPWNALA